MQPVQNRTILFVILTTWWFSLGVPLRAQNNDVQLLVAAMLAETPLIDDLRTLTDEIGGRPTGSAANLQAVEWGLTQFKAAGVAAQKEAFTMPKMWLENSASATISGEVSFSPRVVSMPFSVGTPAAGTTAPLVDGGYGTEDDFQRLGAAAKAAFVLVATHELLDIDGLFREYAEAVEIEKRAYAAGVTGVCYMSSRPKNLLYRHNAALGPDNTKPMLIMEREEAMRAQRLLRASKKLNLTAKIDIRSGGPYESYNVIGEIRGSAKPDEIVVIGAHLDAWGLGTGANDNGCNAAMMIDLARQIKRLGIKPKRTIRFALWNGEEQGMIGSWGYAKTHEQELDKHVMACAIDIGSGRITGFFANGRAELLSVLDKVLMPVAGLGPFENINAPIVGTDNYDFMVQGVANLVGNHEAFNYGPNYHAQSDTYDKVDRRQLRLNAVITAAVTLGFANWDGSLPRQNRTEVENLVNSTDLGDQMRSMGVWRDWQNGTRGRK